MYSKADQQSNGQLWQTPNAIIPGSCAESSGALTISSARGTTTTIPGLCLTAGPNLCSHVAVRSIWRSFISVKTSCFALQAYCKDQIDNDELAKIVNPCDQDKMMTTCCHAAILRALSSYPWTSWSALDPFKGPRVRTLRD